MEHLPSYVAALAATATLFLILPVTAIADNDAATTIPNASGHLTCTGTNTDSSDASWTIGGHIYYVADTSGADYQNGYRNLTPRTNGNQLGSPCLWEVVTLSNVQSGCAQISGNMNIYYTPHGASPTSENCGPYYVPTPAANTIYDPATAITFGTLLNVKNAQFKVTSAQNGSTLGTVATSNL